MVAPRGLSLSDEAGILWGMDQDTGAKSQLAGTNRVTTVV